MRQATATRKIDARKMKAYVVELHAYFCEINRIIRSPFVGMRKIPISSQRVQRCNSVYNTRPAELFPHCR
jgi:hypothetical protein